MGHDIKKCYLCREKPKEVSSKNYSDFRYEDYSGRTVIISLMVFNPKSGGVVYLCEQCIKKTMRSLSREHCNEFVDGLWVEAG